MSGDPSSSEASGRAPASSVETVPLLRRYEFITISLMRKVNICPDSTIMTSSTAETPKQRATRRTFKWQERNSGTSGREEGANPEWCPASRIRSERRLLISFSSVSAFSSPQKLALVRNCQSTVPLTTTANVCDESCNDNLYSTNQLRNYAPGKILPQRLAERFMQFY